MKLNKIIAFAALGIVGIAVYKTVKKSSTLEEVQEVEVEETVGEAVKPSNKKKIIIAGVAIAAGTILVAATFLKNKSSAEKPSKTNRYIINDEGIDNISYSGVVKGFALAKGASKNAITNMHVNNGEVHCDEEYIDELSPLVEEFFSKFNDFLNEEGE